MAAPSADDEGRCLLMSAGKAEETGPLDCRWVLALQVAPHANPYPYVKEPAAPLAPWIWWLRTAAPGPDGTGRTAPHGAPKPVGPPEHGTPPHSWTARPLWPYPPAPGRWARDASRPGLHDFCRARCPLPQSPLILIRLAMLLGL